MLLQNPGDMLFRKAVALRALVFRRPERTSRQIRQSLGFEQRSHTANVATLSQRYNILSAMSAIAVARK
jgi:hypothetical protein